MAGDFSEPTMAAVDSFREYFTDFVTQWEAALAAGGCPAGDLTNRLFEPCPSGRMLTFDERVAYEVLLATGGNETTAQLLSNLVLLLEQDPEVLARLAPSIPACGRPRSRRCCASSRPSPGCSATPPSRSWCTGTELPADAKVLLMYGSGNHDERQYHRPDDFGIDRFPRGFADADHLSFTTGIHVCLGAHLARLLIDVFLERMAERVEGVTVTGPVVRSSNALVRVIEELPVVLHAEERMTATPTVRRRQEGAAAGTGYELGPRAAEEILRAAAALFSTQGIGATRLADVADAVGVTPPAIYYHFANLDDIVEALLQYVVGESAAFATTVARGPGHAGERLHALVRQHVERLTAGPYDLWFVAGMAEVDSRRHRSVARQAATWRRAVAGLVAEGTASGEFAAVDPAVAVAAVSGLVYGALQHHHHGASIDAGLDRRPRRPGAHRVMPGRCFHPRGSDGAVLPAPQSGLTALSARRRGGPAR